MAHRPLESRRESNCNEMKPDAERKKRVWDKSSYETNARVGIKLAHRMKPARDASERDGVDDIEMMDGDNDDDGSRRGDSAPFADWWPSIANDQEESRRLLECDGKTQLWYSCGWRVQPYNTTCAHWSAITMGIFLKDASCKEGKHTSGSRFWVTVACSAESAKRAESEMMLTGRTAENRRPLWQSG